LDLQKGDSQTKIPRFYSFCLLYCINIRLRPAVSVERVKLKAAISRFLQRIRCHIILSWKAAKKPPLVFRIQFKTFLKELLHCLQMFCEIWELKSFWNLEQGVFQWVQFTSAFELDIQFSHDEVWQYSKIHHQVFDWSKLFPITKNLIKRCVIILLRDKWLYKTPYWYKFVRNIYQLLPWDLIFHLLKKPNKVSRFLVGSLKSFQYRALKRTFFQAYLFCI
jgi:hypothetical protein